MSCTDAKPDIEAQINDLQNKRVSGSVMDGGNFSGFSVGSNFVQGTNTDSDDSDDDDEVEEEDEYKLKYHTLKQYIKELMFENAALSDEVAEVQEQVKLYKQQRKKLLSRLLKHDKTLEKQFLEWQSKNSEKSLLNGSEPVPQKRKYKKRSNSDASGTLKTKTTKKSKQSQANPAENVPSSSSSSGSHSKNQTEIPVDKFGQPVYPFSVNGFTVYNLGEVIWNKSGYHTDEYIYPVGYKISRIYGHFKDPEKKCVYTCRVIENGEFPKFEIFANETDPKAFRITGPSPDYCHTTLLQYINNVCVRSIDIRPQGENFFGLSNATIVALIKKLPNANKCQQFNGNGPKASHKTIALNSDATLNYDALQRHISLSVYHTVPEIKEEPPEDLFDISI